MQKKIHLFFFNYLELIFWVVSLIYLGISDSLSIHFSLCPLNNMGFTWCPGCGFGHSVSFLLHGEIMKSITTHPMGIIGFMIILVRIFSLIHFKYFLYNHSTK